MLGRQSASSRSPIGFVGVNSSPRCKKRVDKLIGFSWMEGRPYGGQGVQNLGTTELRAKPVDPIVAIAPFDGSEKGFQSQRLDLEPISQS